MPCPAVFSLQKPFLATAHTRQLVCDVSGNGFCRPKSLGAVFILNQTEFLNCSVSLAAAQQTQCSRVTTSHSSSPALILLQAFAGIAPNVRYDWNTCTHLHAPPPPQEISSTRGEQLHMQQSSSNASQMAHEARPGVERRCQQQLCPRHVLQPMAANSKAA